MWTAFFSSRFRREASGFAEPVYIPGSLTWPVLRVRIFSPTAPISWRVAGELVQLFDPVAGFDVEGGTVILPLNACKLIRFPEFEGEEYYSLKFYPKRWIEDYEIQIEQFV